MKNTIYFFSGTGNSLAVARGIASELGETEIIPIAHLTTAMPASDTKRVGFVFPVYMWGLPLIVSRFLKNIKGLEGKYVFAVATYGGSPGASLQQASQILSSNGITISSGFCVRMPGNYTPMYGALPEKKQQTIFKKAKEKIKLIAEVVREEKKRKIETGNFLINKFLSGMFYSFSSKRIPKMDERFWADEKCNGMGVCVKVCPVGNISMEKGKPVWHHHCEQCLACLQWCPKNALQFGSKTSGRKRYHHPETTVLDFTK